MSRSKPIKWITLASFCLLITVFVFYRTGHFDSYIFGDPQAQPGLSMVANSSNADTVPPKTMLPSSKSAMVTPEMRQTMIKTRDTIARLDSTIKMLQGRIDIMSSSKSGAIFQPGGKYDSIKKLRDSLVELKKKVQGGY
jgi:hypothetical protein